MVKVGADFKFIALEDASCRLPESANSLKSVPFITLSLVASKKTSGSKEAMNSTRCNSTTCFSSSCCLWFSSNLGIGWVSVFKGGVHGPWWIFSQKMDSCQAAAAQSSYPRRSESSHKTSFLHLSEVNTQMSVRPLPKTP